MNAYNKTRPHWFRRFSLQIDLAPILGIGLLIALAFQICAFTGWTRTAERAEQQAQTALRVAKSADARITALEHHIAQRTPQTRETVRRDYPNGLPMWKR